MEVRRQWRLRSDIGQGSSFFIEARYHAVFGATSDAECLVSSEECSDRGTATFIPVSSASRFAADREFRAYPAAGSS